MLTTNEVNYLTLRQDGNISYLPAGKEMKYSPDGQWSRDGRQEGKPAKVIRKLFTKRALQLFKDRDFEGFANAYKARSFGRLTFEILMNKQIPSVYNMETASGDGSLNNSCMNGKGDQMDIYKYCECLRMVALKDEDGLLCGRALVWNLGGGITLMDRIYVVDDHMYELFITYATENGWWHKRNYYSGEDKDIFINDGGKEVRKEFVVTTPTSFESYPYIDTFSYGHNGSLNNYEDGQYVYEYTDGSRGGNRWDDIDECPLDDDDAIRITCGSRRGQWTHVANTWCIGEEVWWVEDSEIVEINGRYYHLDETVMCDYDDVRRLIADCVWSDVHDSYILESEAATHDGKVYHVNALDQLTES